MNISPHIIHSSVLNHLVDSAVDSSRDTIKADLVQKIVYNDPQVFKHLRIDKVDDNLIKACTRLFEVANKEDIELLVEVAEKASNKDSAELDREEKADKADDSNKGEKSGNHGSAEEKRMYDPLVCNILKFLLFPPLTLCHCRCACSTTLETSIRQPPCAEIFRRQTVCSNRTSLIHLASQVAVPT